MQGSAADIIRRAMVRMDGALAHAKLSARMLMQVHDELVFEAPDDEIEATIRLVSKVMVDAPGAGGPPQRAAAGRRARGARTGTRRTDASPELRGSIIDEIRRVFRPEVLIDGRHMRRQRHYRIPVNLLGQPRVRGPPERHAGKIIGRGAPLTA